jgi:hypothetical protein
MLLEQQRPARLCHPETLQRKHMHAGHAAVQYVLTQPLQHPDAMQSSCCLAAAASLHAQDIESGRAGARRLFHFVRSGFFDSIRTLHISVHVWLMPSHILN